MLTSQAREEITQARRASLYRAMEEAGLDVILIYGKGIITQYGYLHYFGGYYPVLRPGFLIFARDREPVAFYSTRADCYLAKEMGTIEDTRFTGMGDVIHSENQLLGDVVQAIHKCKPAKVGVVGLYSQLSYEQHQYFKREIRAEVLDATGLAAEIKAIKSPLEQEGIRESFALAEKSFQAFGDAIRGGGTRAEIAAEVERVARGGGAIDTLVFIEQGPYFLRKPILKPLEKSGLITAYVELIDASGYWVEKAGLFVLGELSAEEKEIGEACVAAMEEVKRTIRPGITVADIADAIHKHTDRLEVQMGIWHGHGIGVDHDIPIIADHGTEVLKPGMVLSVHPNFADRHEGIGASIADVFIIHEDGAESLSRLPYDIVQI